MSKKKTDSFHAYLVESAQFVGKWEIPLIESDVEDIPHKLILFSELKNAKRFNQWVHFYTDDRRFECIWNNPSAYVKCLQKFDGVISPDFSVYRDMPLAMQVNNTYRNRAIAHWLSTKGIKVIPNVRWGDERSYEFCFDGILSNSIVAIGSNGCIRTPTDIAYFKQGLAEMNRRLSPHTILVYGPTPSEVFGEFEKTGIQIISFPSEMQKVHRKERNSEVA